MAKSKPPTRKRAELLADLGVAVAELRREAKGTGLDKLTMREINQIILECRREKDPLSGRTKRIGVSLSERMYREAKAAAEAVGWDLSMLVRQAIGDYLQQLKDPRAPRNIIFAEPERRRIVKAISASTKVAGPPSVTKSKRSNPHWSSKRV